MPALALALSDPQAGNVSAVHSGCSARLKKTRTFPVNGPGSPSSTDYDDDDDCHNVVAKCRSLPLPNAYGSLCNLLFESAMRFDLRKVQELLAAGAAVNASFRAEGSGYSTLLHSLCDLPAQAPPGSLAVLRALLTASANLNPRSSDGSTPLILACGRKNLGAARLLLKSRADVAPFDDFGYDCLRKALVLQDRRTSSSTSRRHTSSSAGGENRTPTKEVQSACSDAMDDGVVSAEIVRLLLGVKNAEEEEGPCSSEIHLGLSKAFFQDDTVERTPPLLVAVRHCNHEAAAVLVASGALPMGLHDAVARGSLELVRVLLSAQADPLEQDAKGETPIDIALQASEDTQMLSALREAARHVLPSQQRTSVLPPYKGSKSGKAKMSQVVDQADLPVELSPLGPHRLCLRKLAAKAKDASQLCQFVAAHHGFQGVMLGMLLGALFIPDMSVLFGSRREALLDSVLLVLLSAFIMELAIQACGLGRAYLRSFFFCTDLVGAASLLLDLSHFQEMTRGSSVGDNAVIMRAARAARLGARAGRFTKLMKLLRFLHGGGESGTGGVGTVKGLTKVLVSRLSILVSCLIIVTMIVLPLFELIKYPEQDFAIQVWVGQLSDAIEESQDVQEVISECRRAFQGRGYYPHSLLHRNSTGELRLLWRSPTKLWPRDAREVVSGNVTVMFNFAGANRVEAGSNLASVTSTIVLMVGFTSMISRSVSQIAVEPLESILNKVRRMGKSIYRNVESMHQQFGVHHPHGGRATITPGGGNGQDGWADFACEIALLDRVLRKLAALSEITMRKNAPDEQMLQYLGEAVAVPEDLDLRNLPGDPYLDDDAYARRSCTMSYGAEFFRETTVAAVHEALGDLPGSATDTVCTWNFNTIDMKTEDLCAVSCAVLRRVLGPTLNLDEGKLGRFVGKAAQGYLKGPQYHNWNHAVDVTHVVAMVLQLCGENARENVLLSCLEESALLVSAVCHDIGHPGLTNDYLVQTSNELTIRYNDTSPLENMHCAKLFEIVTSPGTDIFSGLSKAQYKEVRGICVEAILHTDNKHHVDCVRKLQVLCEMHSEVMVRALELHHGRSERLGGEEDDTAGTPTIVLSNSWPSRELLDVLWEPENRSPLRNALLHFSDISNPVRPFKLCKDWAVVILEEFFAQGDLELRKGLPMLPLHDRARTSLAFSQIGFIDFFAAPLVLSAARLLAPLTELAEQLVLNANFWAEDWLQEASPSDEDLQALWQRIRRLEERLATLRPSSTPAHRTSMLKAARRSMSSMWS